MPRVDFFSKLKGFLPEAFPIKASDHPGGAVGSMDTRTFAGTNPPVVVNQSCKLSAALRCVTTDFELRGHPKRDVSGRGCPYRGR
jgi:hypothetical protein